MRMPPRSNIRTTPDQLRIILNFMKEHRLMNKGGRHEPEEKQEYRRLWRILQLKLNSRNRGPQKTVDKWMKAWSDWKSNVRSKRAQEVHELDESGGDTQLKTKLSELECELLDFLDEGSDGSLPRNPALECGEVVWLEGEEPLAGRSLETSESTVAYPGIKRKRHSEDIPTAKRHRGSQGSRSLGDLDEDDMALNSEDLRVQTEDLGGHEQPTWIGLAERLVVVVEVLAVAFKQWLMTKIMDAQKDK